MFFRSCLLVKYKKLVLSVRNINSQFHWRKVSDFINIFRELIFVQFFRWRKLVSINEFSLEVIMQLFFFRSCVLLYQLQDNSSIIRILLQWSRSEFWNLDWINSIFSRFEIFCELLRILNLSILNWDKKLHYNMSSSCKVCK